VIGVAQNINQSRLLVIRYSLLISRNLKKKSFELPGELWSIFVKCVLFSFPNYIINHKRYQWLLKPLRWLFQMHISTDIKTLFQVSQFINWTKKSSLKHSHIIKIPTLSCCNTVRNMVLLNLVQCRYTKSKHFMPHKKNCNDLILM